MSLLRFERSLVLCCLGVVGISTWTGNALSDDSEQGDAARTAAAMHAVGPVPGPPSQRPHVPASNPYEGDAAARQTGRRLFVAFNCSGCHGGHAGGGMGPSLRDQDWIYGGKPGEIFSSIADGRAHGMPAWGTRLPPEVIWQLVTYIESLRTPDEAEPPQ